MLKKCELNKNHWYSNHLSYCPWCKVANETGIDPFPQSPKVGTQESVSPEVDWSDTKSHQSSLGIKPKKISSIPENNPKKTNSALYKTIIPGIILCSFVLIGYSIINGHLENSNNLPNTSQGVSHTPNSSVASEDTTSRVETVTVSEQPTVTITEQPILLVAAFSASPTSGEAPLTVTFIDESTGSPTAWKWEFGDNTGSTQQYPTHTYSAAGIYIVKEIVWNQAGNTDTGTKTVTISKPITNADKEPTSASVMPTNTASATPTSTASATPTRTARSTPTSTARPTPTVKADFSASPSSGEAPLTVIFNDESTGSPTAWKWNFGDGSDLVTDYNPTHTYSIAGTYTVKETVSNVDSKDTEIKTNYIEVLENINENATPENDLIR